MDILIIALCISIGTGVPWLVAIYTERGAYQLIENSVLALAATALAAAALWWLLAEYSLIALVFLGPLVAYFAIAAGQAAKRVILTRLRRARTG